MQTFRTVLSFVVVSALVSAVPCALAGVTITFQDMQSGGIGTVTIEPDRPGTYIVVIQVGTGSETHVIETTAEGPSEDLDVDLTGAAPGETVLVTVSNASGSVVGQSQATVL